MHAELSGKLRASRKALQNEQSALQKEREAHLCTLTVLEAFIEEAAQYGTKEAKDIATNVAVQEDRHTATAGAKHNMTDPREEKRERKRVATRFPSLDGPYSLSRSPKGLHTSRPHSEMLGKSSYATSKKTRTQRGWLNGANVAGFDGSKDEERPLDCVARTITLCDTYYQRVYFILHIRTIIMPVGQQESGVTSGVKFVTSTVGNTVGGVTNTVGGVVGALGRGVGETLEGATGSAGRPVARGIADATTSIEDGAGKIAGGVKRAGEGK
ncbi:hypothetical protein PSPO01_14897 [Paraphaeosphaeria sporulosa]